MEYVFRISRYNDETLLDEISAALEKQVELSSRVKLPSIWHIIDKVDNKRAPEGVIKKRRIIRKIYGIILIVLGLLLLVPGLVKPKELLLPLFTGAFGVIAGILCIWPAKMRSNRKYCKAAKKLLTGMKKLQKDPNKPLLVRFTKKGMNLPDKITAPYSDFQTIIETANIYFLVWQGKVTLLQKKDLSAKETDSFITFLEKMTGLQRITLT